jgi:hypothetical protein
MVQRQLCVVVERPWPGWRLCCSDVLTCPGQAQLLSLCCTGCMSTSASSPFKVMSHGDRGHGVRACTYQWRASRLRWHEHDTALTAEDLTSR